MPAASGGRNKNAKTTILGKTAVPLAVPSLQQQPVPGEAVRRGQEQSDVFVQLPAAGGCGVLLSKRWCPPGELPFAHLPRPRQTLLKLLTTVLASAITNDRVAQSA